MKRNLRQVAVDALTPDQAVAEIEALAREIAEHDEAYYQNDAPGISDAEDDSLRRANKPIQTPFS